jgi:hypothetical protein
MKRAELREGQAHRDAGAPPRHGSAWSRTTRPRCRARRTAPQGCSRRKPDNHMGVVAHQRNTVVSPAGTHDGRTFLGALLIRPWRPLARHTRCCLAGSGKPPRRPVRPDDVIGTKVRALADRGTSATSSTSRLPPATTPQPTSNPWAAVAPTTSSASKTSGTGSLARTGTRMRTTPRTGSLPPDRRTQGVGAGVGEGSGCADP